MCVNQKCIALSEFRAKNKACLNDCNGNGVCNSKGHCHCNVGYDPPYCDHPGPGGSEDSGPASSTYGKLTYIYLFITNFYKFSISAHKGFLTGMYVLTFGAIPLLLAVLLFAYCSKNHRSPSDWNKNNRKQLSYVSKSLSCTQRLKRLFTDVGDGNSNACTTTITSPRPNISTVSTLVAQYGNVNSVSDDACSFYNNMPEPIYETILENAYANHAYSVTEPNRKDVTKSPLKKSDIIISNLKSTTNPRVNSYLQDGVWRYSN